MGGDGAGGLACGGWIAGADVHPSCIPRARIRAAQVGRPHPRPRPTGGRMRHAANGGAHVACPYRAGARGMHLTGGRMRHAPIGQAHVACT